MDWVEPKIRAFFVLQSIGNEAKKLSRMRFALNNPCNQEANHNKRVIP